jgi:L-amino acid N-acyltransferase YncA
VIVIRDFIKADFAVVNNIYQQGIDTGHATFQSKAKTWLEWDSSLIKACRLVADEQGLVIGWAGLSSVSARSVYAGVAEITVYVAAEAQGKGVGLLLLSELVCRSEELGYWTLQAGIFPENQASIALHQKCGFRVLGLREKVGRMGGLWRDTLLLERRSLIVGLD